MTFEWPILLWGLLLVPLALAAYLLAQRRRARYAVRFTNLDLLSNVVRRTPGWRRHLPMVLYLTAFAALVVSLARPQALVQLPREQAVVMLVMDISGSMEATDVKPNLLAAAKSAAQTFLDQVPPTFQVGLVSFASEARTIAPPTTDRAAVKRAIEGLRAAGGTAMGDGLEHALATGQATQAAAGPTPVPTAWARPTASPAAQSAAPAAATPVEEVAPLAVVLLSDGANTSGRVDPASAAQHAKALGVPVFTISLGTDQGTVSVAAPRGGNRALRVPPDERTLQEISEVTGGRFFEAPTASDLQVVYQDLGSRLGWIEEHQEVTVLFAGAALALLALGSTLALHWFNRFPQGWCLAGMTAPGLRDGTSIPAPAE